MTQEEKDLLLKDLSARFPYGVKCEIDDLDEPLELESIKYKGDYFIFGNGVYERYITEIKPYLRPMSSMTLDEFNEFTNIVEHICIGKLQINIANPEAFDWLNTHHFDYRGLIEKGLALEALKGMYETEKQ